MFKISSNKENKYVSPCIQNKAKDKIYRCKWNDHIKFLKTSNKETTVALTTISDNLGQGQLAALGEGGGIKRGR